MAKLEATNPVSGSRIDVGNPTTWVSYLLGFGFLLILFNLGKSLWDRLVGRVPTLGKIGSDVPFMDEAARVQVVSGDLTSAIIRDYGEAV